MIDEAAKFILACYNMTEKKDLTEARIETWKLKMRERTLEPPKLSSLSPTNVAFRENALRAHHQLIKWRNSLKTTTPMLDPTLHGWKRVERRNTLVPTMVPEGTVLAPKELLKVIQCGCNSKLPCKSMKCGCKSQGLPCTLFCLCKDGSDCCNKLVI